ncbi:MAG: LCP family protein [Halanaerobiales bacterium]|nr:LCP family protein [Halanaerobiales bacterium]
MDDKKEGSKNIKIWILLLILLFIALMGFYLYNNYGFLFLKEQKEDSDMNTDQEKNEEDIDENTPDENIFIENEDKEGLQGDTKAEPTVEDKSNQISQQVAEDQATQDGQLPGEDLATQNNQEKDTKGIVQEKVDDTKQQNNVQENDVNIEQEVSEEEVDKVSKVTDQQEKKKSDNENIKENEQESTEQVKKDIHNGENKENLLDDKDNIIQEDGFKKEIYLLLIGQDQESNVKEGKVQSDSIILANLISDQKKLVINAISSHDEYKGNRLLEFNKDQLLNIINDIIGIVPGYYFVIDYEGFQNIVNFIGGVEVKLEEDFTVPELGLFLKEGANLLSGQEALNYVRYYDPNENELTRINRQQQVTKSLVNKVFKRNTLLNIPTLYRTVLETIKSVQTNLDYKLAVEAYNFIRNSDDFDIEYEVLVINDNSK